MGRKSKWWEPLEPVATFPVKSRMQSSTSEKSVISGREYISYKKAAPIILWVQRWLRIKIWRHHLCWEIRRWAWQKKSSPCFISLSTELPLSKGLTGWEQLVGTSFCTSSLFTWWNRQESEYYQVRTHILEACVTQQYHCFCFPSPLTQLFYNSITPRGTSLLGTHSEGEKRSKHCETLNHIFHNMKRKMYPQQGTKTGCLASAFRSFK